MSDNKTRSFLEDIIAHPDDDAIRLIFADWLEEHGDNARAEFIRVQIERVSMPEWDRRQVRLRLRERALLKRNGQKWKAELPAIKGISWEEFRRGFVATATFQSFAVLRAKASDCWAAAPIEAISVRWPRHRESSAALARLAGLRELSITGSYVDYREVDRLADAPLLSTLRALNIRECSLGSDGFRRVVASPHLGNLTALRVPYNFLGNLGIFALSKAVSLTSLTELDLSEMGSYGRYGEDTILDADGLETLAGWSGMTRVRSLNLSGNDVRGEGLSELLQSPRCRGLKELVLRATGLIGKAMQEFTTAQPELQLDVLNLGENLLRDAGAAHLAMAPCLRELKVLELACCEMPSPATARLARAPFLNSLRQLNADSNSFGPEGLLAMLEKNPQELHTLSMVGADLDAEGVSRLADSPASDTLLEVNLSRNGLGDSAVQTLAKAKHLRNLLILRLNENNINKPAALALARSALGKRLTVLEKAAQHPIPF